MSEQLAIDGGVKTRELAFPPWPVLSNEDAAASSDALRSGKLTQLTGSYVRDFERDFGMWNGSGDCIATSSGTTAIHTVLIALDIGPGDEVIVPAHTFIASATPVLHQRATPAFADVDENTFCLDPASVRERVTDRTKAIIAVHLNGHPADMDPLLEIAAERGIAVIEDAAQAHGAVYKARMVGTIGIAGCFSFWEDKIMTTGGEGGAIVTDDDTFGERLKRIRHHGEGPVEGERAYYHLELGYNYRMTSMQAATGRVQLQHLGKYIDTRRHNAEYLTERLGSIDGVDAPFVAEYAQHSYYKYICRLRPDTGIEIERFIAAVAAEGLPISRRYPTPLTKQPVFRDAGLGDEPCPVADRLGGELFTLLVHPTLGLQEMEDYAQGITKVLRGLS